MGTADSSDVAPANSPAPNHLLHVLENATDPNKAYRAADITEGSGKCRAFVFNTWLSLIDTYANTLRILLHHLQGWQVSAVCGLNLKFMSV